MKAREEKTNRRLFSNKKALILISFEIYIVCWGIGVVNQCDYLIFYMRFCSINIDLHTHTHTHRNKNLEHKRLLMSICLSFTNTFIMYMYVYINDNSVREMNVVFIWGKWKILYFIVFRVLWCFIRRSVSISELKMNGNPGVIDAFVLVRIFFLLHFVRNYWYGNNKIIVLYY